MPADRRTGPGQRPRDERVHALLALVADDAGEVALEHVEVAEHRLAGADDRGQGDVVVAVDVAPLEALGADPLVGHEAQPPAATLGERHADPAHVGELDQVVDQAARDLVHVARAAQRETQTRQMPERPPGPHIQLPPARTPGRVHPPPRVTQ